jgi:hypothetical protein
MNALPQTNETYRSPRARLDHTPVVLRFPDGQQSRAELNLVSVTGGLLSLPRPTRRGAQVKLMFLTQTGTVMGSAEMLSAISWGEQPFRFVSFAEGHKQRLETVIHSSLTTNRADDQWIDKYRAVSAQNDRPRKRIGKIVLTAIAVAAAGGAVLCGLALR